MGELVTWRTDGEVAIITLNNPQRLNTMSGERQQQLCAQRVRVVADAAVCAVVLTAAGRAFCVGADLTGFAGDDSDRSLGQRTADPMRGQKRAPRFVGR
jgi:2-(1,2-epoxy-1,2-dihydrophenyl)acetyl-CoA isomerase